MEREILKQLKLRPGIIPVEANCIQCGKQHFVYAPCGTSQDSEIEAPRRSLITSGYRLRGLLEAMLMDFKRCQ
jgi:hypothetical protein